MAAKTFIKYPIQKKRLWRCHVCNDLHYGDRPPLICPTCGAKNAFVEVDRDEALKVIGDRGGAIESVDEVTKVWENFGGANEDFKLTDDREMVGTLASGVLENSKSHGLKYCPCRITTGDQVKDLELICPCEFEIQDRYHEAGECFCGLFAKRK